MKERHPPAAILVDLEGKEPWLGVEQILDAFASMMAGASSRDKRTTVNRGTVDSLSVASLRSFSTRRSNIGFTTYRPVGRDPTSMRVDSKSTGVGKSAGRALTFAQNGRSACTS
jgi:hypothetical protein